MVTMVVVVVIEQITQETSDETSRASKPNIAYSPLSLGVPAPASCRRSGCLQTGLLRQKQIRPSVTCRTFFLSVTTLLQAWLWHAREGLKMQSFSTEQHAIEGAIAFDNVD